MKNGVENKGTLFKYPNCASPEKIMNPILQGKEDNLVRATFSIFNLSEFNKWHNLQ